ncbi:MAG TPA: C40 family peptidase [Actinomycetales bacterium]|nr:C40 family peptidase [Actinomycetales bacterium]
MAVSTLLAVAVASPAQADPSSSELRAKADKLRTTLDELRVKQQLAVEEYDEAQQALDVATTDQVLATTRLEDAQRSASGAMSASAQRARAIYMSGGTVGMAATVLEATSISDVMTRLRALQTIVQTDASTVVERDTDVVDQRARAEDAEQARTTTRQRQARATAALAAIEATLTEQKDLLARTDAQVVELAEAERAAAEEAARQQAEQLAQQAGIGTSWDVGTLPAAPNVVAARAIAAARSRLGAPYVWGATGPSSFDCSGLTQWAYREAGLVIPRTSRQQYAALPHVPLDQLLPGDLVFYATDVANPATIHHVGMYLGEGLSIYAPETGDVVKIGAVGYGRIIGAARPTG